MLRAQATRGGPITIAQSGVASSVTGTTAETTLASIVIPGGMLGLNGAIRVVSAFSYTNSANTKSLRIKLGGVTASSTGPTTSASVQGYAMIRNRGAENSQVSFTNFLGSAVSSAAVTTLSADTSVNQALTITAQLADIGETITLEGYTVEVLPS